MPPKVVVQPLTRVYVRESDWRIWYPLQGNFENDVDVAVIAFRFHMDQVARVDLVPSCRIARSSIRLQNLRRCESQANHFIQA